MSQANAHLCSSVHRNDPNAEINLFDFHKNKLNLKQENDCYNFDLNKIKQEKVQDYSNSDEYICNASVKEEFHSITIEEMHLDYIKEEINSENRYVTRLQIKIIPCVLQYVFQV